MKSRGFCAKSTRLAKGIRMGVQVCKAMFDFGIVESLHPCLCQKHPRTSIIVFALGITMSGLPLNRLSHTLNRQPQANSRLRTIISGNVSLPRIFAITRLRCSVVNVSISNQSVVCIFSKRPARAPVSIQDNLRWIRPSAPIPLHLCNLRLTFVDRIKNYLVPPLLPSFTPCRHKNNAQAVSMHSALKDSFNSRHCISCLTTIFSSSSAFISVHSQIIPYFRLTLIKPILAACEAPRVGGRPRPRRHA